MFSVVLRGLMAKLPSGESIKTADAYLLRILRWIRMCHVQVETLSQARRFLENCLYCIMKMCFEYGFVSEKINLKQNFSGFSLTMHTFGV